jgi:hypothetical protein
LFRYRDRFQVPKTPLAFHPRTFLRGLSQDETHRELVYRRFQFQKRRQLFIRSRNETLSVVAVRVNNPDRSASLPS